MRSYMKIFLLLVIILLLLIIFSLPLFAQDVQRLFLAPPFQGQWSGFSKWTIPQNAFEELTNWMINEQGLLQTRPGAYCYLDSANTSERIYGAYEYTKRIEGGSSKEIVFQNGDKLYKTSGILGASNTDISGSLNFSKSGNPLFFTHFNRLFMANGENNSIVYEQDGNCRIIGYETVEASCRFVSSTRQIDSNEIDFDDYYFRPSMDLTITGASDSNNNDTFEILSIDANVITLSTSDSINDESYVTITLVGYSGPSELSSLSSTETVTNVVEYTTMWDTNILVTYAGNDNHYDEGFRAGQTLTVSGSALNDGSYTILDVGTDQSYTSSDGNLYMYSPSGISYISITTNGFTSPVFETSSPFTLTGTTTITVTERFAPAVMAGHKGRLFAAGIKKVPNKLYFTVSKVWADYYYDIWRNRTGYRDGAGDYDLLDKINALIPEYYEDMVILCENSIWKQRGDDPGFDITTPTQTMVYQLIPISADVGCVGPNAWCRAGNEIYFWSKQGLQKLSTIEQLGNYKIGTVSLPINDIHSQLVANGLLSKLKMVYSPEFNSILISCAYGGTANDTLIYYNIPNNAFAIWSFLTGKEPTTVFLADTVIFDPNDEDYEIVDPDPYRTFFLGTEDGKLWAMNRNLGQDYDYEDIADYTIEALNVTAITSILQPIDEFIEKNFQRIIVAARVMNNYIPDTSTSERLNIYYKIDNGEWSSINTLYFDGYSGTKNAKLDYYEFFPLYNISTNGRGIQFKFITTGQWGAEIKKIMLEYLPMNYDNYNIN